MSRLAASKVFVAGLRVEARIGVHHHEQGDAQPLVIDVELETPTNASDRLAETVNYETILDAARAVAREGRLNLVETFAHRLAERCLADARVSSARVRIEKPLALAPDAAAAGVEIVLTRD